MKTKLQIVQGFRSMKNEAKYKIMKTTWLYKSAGFTGLGMSNTGINHCKQYISLLALQNGAFFGWGLDFLTPQTIYTYVMQLCYLLKLKSFQKEVDANNLVARRLVFPDYVMQKATKNI